MNTTQEYWESGCLLNTKPQALEPNVLPKEKIAELILQDGLTKTLFNNIEEEDEIVELFTQVREIPENKGREIDQLGGNVERFGVVLGDFSQNTIQMYELQKQFLANYVHNVEGEVYKSSYYGENGEHGQTYYLAVPSDAPLINESIDKFIDSFSKFVNEYEDIMKRYYIRNTAGINTPARNTENYYLDASGEEYKLNKKYTFLVILIAFALIFLKVTLFRY